MPRVAGLHRLPVIAERVPAKGRTGGKGKHKVTCASAEALRFERPAPYHDVDALEKDFGQHNDEAIRSHFGSSFSGFACPSVHNTVCCFPLTSHFLEFWFSSWFWS